MQFLKQLDINLLSRIYQWPFERTLFVRALIFIGDGPFWLLVMLACALSGWLMGDVQLLNVANLMMAGLMIGNFIFVPLKTNIKRRRPYANPELQQKLGLEIINRDPGHGSKELESFPSGHAMWPTISVLLLSFQFGWPVLLILGWLIPAMMLLRPYLGVHYPSDTLVGFSIGLAIFAAVASVSHIFQILGSELLISPWYIWIAYWVFVSVFIYLGIKSWLRRV